MTSQNKKSDVLLGSAIDIYNWFKSPSEKDLPLKWVDDLYSHVSYNNPGQVIKNQSVISYILSSSIKDYIKDPNFEYIRTGILKEWSTAFENETPINEEIASRFLGHYMSGMNHSYIYNDSIVAGKTSYIVGDSILDDIITYYEPNRTTWTLQLTIDGSGTYSYGKTVSAEAGCAILHSPDSSCHFHRTPNNDRWVHYWIVFEPKHEWLNLLKWPILGHGIYRLDIKDMNSLNKLIAIFDEIMKDNTLDFNLDNKLYSNLTEQLLIRLTRNINVKNITSIDPRVEKACQFLQLKFKEKTSLSNLASHCQISESRLSHLFTKTMGISINQYKSHLRIQFAKQELLESTKSISTIGDELGFSDPPQFSRFFTKEVGKSPKSYRTNYQSIDTK